jgi:hypothetical protein
MIEVHAYLEVADLDRRLGRSRAELEDANLRVGLIGASERHPHNYNIMEL